MRNKGRKEFIALSDTYRKSYLSHISIDSVVFGFHDNSLKVLLARADGETNWMLPGGYVQKKENMSDAAKRILFDRTGAADIFLKQFATFGDLNRSENFFEDFPDELFQKQRFITIGYYALVDFTQLDPKIDMFSDACSWHDTKNLPGFVMDHGAIYSAALAQLRRDLNFSPVGYNLLPEKFTLSELQRLYEVILDKELNRGNFYRKIMRYDILIKLDETRRGGNHKAPNYYIFNQENYAKALQNGFQEIW